MSRRGLHVARRSRLARLAAVALGVLGACQGSDPQPLEPVGLDRFGDQASLVAGGGRAATIGHTAVTGFLPTLRLTRLDPADADRTVFLGDVAFGGGGDITRLSVTDEAAAVVVGGVAVVVALTGPSLPAVPRPDLGQVDDLAVNGHWLLAVVGSELILADREAPFVSAPHLAPGRPTALLATGSGFLAFTESGYVVVDPTGAVPSFTDVSDPRLRNVRSAFADGDGAVVAGPAATFDRSRVLRLDLADPAAPAVVRSHEVPGTYVAFAWDGGRTAVLAVHGAGDGADPQAFHQGYVVREGERGFSATGVPLTTWARSSQPLAARAEHLAAVSAPGLLLLRIR